MFGYVKCLWRETVADIPYQLEIIHCYHLKMQKVAGGSDISSGRKLDNVRLWVLLFDGDCCVQSDGGRM